MADFASDIIAAAGGKPTASSLAALRAWQRWEGGHTNNSATYNWLNRTDQGFPKINSVGVAAYPDYQTGIKRTVELLRSGYPTVFQGLQQGQIDFNNPAVQGDMNRWLTGKRTPGMTPYVAKIAKTAGQNPGPLQQQGSPMMQTAGAPVSTTGFTGVGSPSDANALLAAAGTESDPRKQTLALMGALLAGSKQMGPAQTAMAPAGPAAAGPVTSPMAAGGKGSSDGIRELFYDPAGAYDEGNWINPIGGHSDHVHASFGNPQVAIAAIKLAQKMGLRASENPYAEHSAPEPGVHTKTSYHYQYFPGMYDGWKLGRGLDVSGPADKMGAYFQAVKQNWIR